MSMIGNLLRVSTAELEAFLKDSSKLENTIYDPETDEENPNLTDIDKAWDGIIFLLTGKGIVGNDHPLLSVLFSGQVFDEEQDMGYGPANYLTPEQVADLNTQIATITIEDLKQKYDPEKMTTMQVYPTIWDEGDEAFDYLAEHFLTVQKVFAEATKNGEAVITFLN